jgi:hypothetical protein
LEISPVFSSLIFSSLSNHLFNQPFLVQEIETLRREVAEVAAWRGITLKSGTTGKHAHGLNWDAYHCSVPPFANSNRVKKLTKFFGTEPPLLRQFLRKLGYEVTLHHSFIPLERNLPVSALTSFVVAYLVTKLVVV